MKKTTILIFATLLLASIVYADTYKITVPLDIDGVNNGLTIGDSSGNNHLVTNVGISYKVECLINGELTEITSRNKYLDYNEEGIHKDIIIEFESDKVCDAAPKYTAKASFGWINPQALQDSGGTLINSTETKGAVGSNLATVVATATGKMTKIN